MTVGGLGHPTDPTGLIYMRARYYDPETGRFISEDPSGNGGNWYVYADDDPIDKADSTGKAPLTPQQLQDLMEAWHEMEYYSGWILVMGPALLFGKLGNALVNSINAALGVDAPKAIADAVAGSNSADALVVEYDLEATAANAALQGAADEGAKDVMEAGEVEATISAGGE